MNDPIRLCAALVPLAIYACLVGILNLRRRPFLTSAGRDTTALGIAISGMMLIGPIELFAPETAFDQFGAFVWLLLICLYSLVLTLIVMLQRPGLMIYNLSLDEFRPVLAEVIQSIEPDPRWAGNTLALPSLGVELHVESFAPLRNIRLLSVGDHQSLGGWRYLETALSESLAKVEVRPATSGVGFLTLGLVLLAASFWGLYEDYDLLVQEVKNLRGP